MRPLGEDISGINHLGGTSLAKAASSVEASSSNLSAGSGISSNTPQIPSHIFSDLQKADEIVTSSIPELIKIINKRRSEQIKLAFPNERARLAQVSKFQQSFLTLFKNGEKILIPQAAWNSLNQILKDDRDRGGYETYESRREKNIMFEALNDKQGYRTDRSLSDYDECYKAVTGISLVDKLKSLQEGKPLRVFDEGCGQGQALKDIKANLGKGVHTIGLGLSDLKDPTAVDEFHKANAEEWLTKEPLDMVLSFCGGTYYSQEEVKWPLMLKNAFSLSENGEAMFVLYLDKDLRGYQGKDLSSQKANLLTQIKKYFNDNGFEFESKSFAYNRFSAIQIPKGHETDVVIIRRKK